jgi:hypothetical protein
MESAQRTQDQTGRLFGIEDPRLQKQTKIQDAAEAVRKAGVDTKDPEATYRAFYDELAKRGLYGEATALIPKIQEAAAKGRAEQREEKRIGLEERRINLQLQQEERAGRLTEAQIREINARINNVDKENYTFQVVKDAVGNITEIIAINKKNPADVKRIPVGAQEAGPAADGSKPKLTDDEVRQRLLGGRGGANTTAPENLPIPAGA